MNARNPSQTRRRMMLVTLALFATCLVSLLFGPEGSFRSLHWFQVVTAGLWGLLVFLGILNLLLYLFGFAPGKEIDRGMIGKPANDLSGQSDARVRVAVVMPCYHEDPEQVYGRIRTTWRSAVRTGLAKDCDFYLLSDSRDVAIRLAEDELIAKLAREFSGGGPQIEQSDFRNDTTKEESGCGGMFLVRRDDRKNFKAGNIWHFLATHGGGYDFMLVLDADSVMLGRTVRRMILRMEASPNLAILQSTILPIRAVTPFARAMEYSLARTMPLFARGIYWFFGKQSVYWGHNALIRIAPFMAYAQLPTLPGRPPLGGPILSQDIVEAALLGRAGWDIEWDVKSGGSFDELPANILTYGQRDRRWCRGNFQHCPFIFWRGMKWGHRFYFANGIFTYLAGPLLLFLIFLGFIQSVGSEQAGSMIVFNWRFLCLLFTMLAVPRTLGLLRLWRIHRERDRNENRDDSNTISTTWSGWTREIISTGFELAISILVAPLFFYLHDRFVIEILSGRAVPWKNQSRNPAEGLAWRDAVRLFWPTTIIGALWLVMSAAYASGQLVYLAPILFSWVVSIPLSVLLSSPACGQWLMHLGLFPDAFSASEAEELEALADSVSHVGCERRSKISQTDAVSASSLTQRS